MIEFHNKIKEDLDTRVGAKKKMMKNNFRQDLAGSVESFHRRSNRTGSQERARCVKS